MDNLLDYSSSLIALKRSLKKDSTADMYRATHNHLRAFVGSDCLPFSSVTAAFVEHFRSGLVQAGLAVNSVNSYLSCFRAIYNSAVREELFQPSKNPFFRLRLKREITAKRALPLSVLKEACHLKLSEPELVRSRDYYLFSFLTCGMAFVDLAHLTLDNIVGSEIVYNRRKTGTQVRVGITPGIRTLLRRYSSPDSRYLFPLLHGDGSHEVYKASLAGHNGCLKEIGLRLHVPVRLTSYVARHSWATEALRQNIPVAVISQALGHTSEKTTRYYLDLLDQSELNKANARITRTIAELVNCIG